MIVNTIYSLQIITETTGDKNMLQEPYISINLNAKNHLRRLMSRYQYDKNVFISVMGDLYTFPKGGITVFMMMQLVNNKVGKTKLCYYKTKWRKG